MIHEGRKNEKSQRSPCPITNHRVPFLSSFRKKLNEKKKIIFFFLFILMLFAVFLTLSLYIHLVSYNSKIPVVMLCSSPSLLNAPEFFY